MLRSLHSFILAIAIGAASAASGCSGDGGEHSRPAVDPNANTRPAPTLCRPPLVPPAFRITNLFPNSRFSQPVTIARSGDTFFVAEQAGKIRRLEPAQTPSSDSSASWTDTVFADLSGELVASEGVEGGLIGFTPSPDFASTGEVFATYLGVGDSGANPVRTVVARLLSRDGGVTADITSRETVLSLDRGTDQSHNGGRLVFGPDRFLYIGIGDGSYPNAELRQRAQDPKQLFGKVLRLDPLSGHPYLIPTDNPFADGTNGRPEVYAFGFRNPWSFSFDVQTGLLWMGDVGHERWEEIDIVKKGGNYGWPIKEARHCFATVPCADVPDLTDPIHEYAHIDGLAVMGGYVYRGTKLSSLRGRYIFGDFMTGRLWSLDAENYATEPAKLVLDTGLNISSFGEDAENELLIVDYSGRVLRLDPAEPNASPLESPETGPITLSSLHCFSSASSVAEAHSPPTMEKGLVPYDVIAPLWADTLDKRRWFSIPAESTIKVNDDGALDLPVGAMFLKELSAGGHRVETRMFVRDAEFGWLAYTFAWNADQTDATLVSDVQGTQTVTVALSSGDSDPANAEAPSPATMMTWTIPSRAQCSACHTSASGRILGFELAQLNRARVDDAAENQLDWLTRVGLLSVPKSVGAESESPSNNPASPSSPSIDRTAIRPVLVDPYDANASLDLRARSYLHANCSFCHRPSGPGQGQIDLRANIPLESMNLLCRRPETSEIDTQDVLVQPGEPTRSMLTKRISGLNGEGRMPPLGSTQVDTRALDLISTWVAWLEGCL